MHLLLTYFYYLILIFSYLSDPQEDGKYYDNKCISVHSRINSAIKLQNILLIFVLTRSLTLLSSLECDQLESTAPTSRLETETKDTSQ